MNRVILTPPGAVGEVVNLRTLPGKTFDMGGLNRKTITGGRPAHYEDSRGTLQDIDPQIVPRVGGGYEVTGAPYRAEFSDQFVGVRYRSRRGGEMRARMVEVGTGTPVVGQQRVVGNKIQWRDVGTGVDVMFVVLANGIQTHHRIKSAAGLREVYWEIEKTDDQSTVRINTKPRGRDNGNGRTHTTLGRHKRDRYRMLEIVPQTDEIERDGKKIVRLRERWTGRVAKVTDPARGKREWTDRTADIEFPIIMRPPDFTENITANTDDGSDIHGTTWDANNSMFGRYNNAAHTHSGFRFQTVALTNAITITLAELKISVKQGYKSATGAVWGDDVDDAPTWGAADRPGQITQTTANTALTVAAADDDTRITVDVTDIIQEIVDRGGWATGQDLRLSAIATSATDDWSTNIFNDYYSGTWEYGSPATLEVDWIAAGGPASGAGLIAFTFGVTAVGASAAEADGSGTWALSASAEGESAVEAVGASAWAMGADAIGASAVNAEGTSDWVFGADAASASSASAVGTSAWAMGANATSAATKGAAGTSAWAMGIDAAGASAQEAAGSSAWQLGATAGGASSQSGIGSSAWVFAASSVGASAQAATGSQSWVMGLTAEGAVTGAAAGAGSQSWVTTFNAIGASAQEAPGSSAWQFGAAAIGASSASAVGSSAWVFDASAIGASSQAATGSQSWVMSMTAVGDAAGSAAGAGSQTWVMSLAAVGASAQKSTGSSPWTLTPSAIGASAQAAAGSSSWVASLSAIGASAQESVGSSAWAASLAAIGVSAAGGAGTSTWIAGFSATGASATSAAGSSSWTLILTAVGAADGGEFHDLAIAADATFSASLSAPQTFSATVSGTQTYNLTVGNQ